MELGMGGDAEWICLELRGYWERFRAEGEETASLPQYRRARCEYYDDRGRRVAIAKDLAFVEQIPVGQPVAQIEERIGRGLTIDGSRLQLLRKEMGLPVHSGIVPAAELERIVRAVRSRLSDFLDRALVRLSELKSVSTTASP